MNRFYLVLKICAILMSIYIVYNIFIVLSIIINMANSRVTDFDSIWTLLILLTVAIVFSFTLYFSKKYLLNFSYFNISKEINNKDNILSDNEISYEALQYEE